MNVISYYFLVLISSIFSHLKCNSQEKKQVLKQQGKKRKSYLTKEIGMIIIIAIIFIAIVVIVFQTGSLESTQYYYRIQNI